jgi:hypothetical protein
MVVPDNVEDSPEFLSVLRDGGQYLSVAIGPDVEVAIRAMEGTR